MILIPGLSSSGDVWNSTVARYQDHYRCYVLTLAGFAGQPAMQGAADRAFMQTVTNQLIAYIRDNHLQRPTIVGHSLGGVITLNLAEQHPQETGPLVIVDSLPFLAQVWFGSSNEASAQPIAARMRDSILDESQLQYQQYVRSGAGTRPLVTGDTDYTLITNWGLQSNQQTVADAIYNMLSTDLRPGIKKIQSPMLVMGTWVGTPGGKEKTVQKEFDRQYAGAQNAKIVIADHARHFIMYDDPTWFFAQMDSFLAANYSVSPGTTTASM